MIALILVQRMAFLQFALQALKIVDLVRFGNRKVEDGQLRRCR